MAALTFVVIGFMMVDGTLATVLNEARSIFQNLTQTLGDSLGIATTDSTFDVELVTIGEVDPLYPGGTATHQIAVKNNGTLPACFRIAFAVQYDKESWDLLNISFTINENYTPDQGWRDISIGGTPYRMMVFTYKNTLPAGEQSTEASITITMDKHVTSEQIRRYRSDFMQAQVLAIDADTFLNARDKNDQPIYPTPEAALDAALPLNDPNRPFNPFY